MKELWCWRCKMTVPMLDKDEFEIAKKLYNQGFKTNGINIKERFKPLLDYYTGLTGFDETVPNAIMHHAIHQYGPPCGKCGKPYRTPKASYCPACGNKRKENT
ncbi:hypothetical protein [Ulvibacterium marinum]|uniref:Zinc ribbon domain-containing protein n=1 Tax=Ulvibacterium marinum TaxID=2419782 RepID=A0A3B0BZC1_9FLAO|nr:hypothetical protein [Ulvibacterium marinum]RKN78522.1 hypothetical protein D7Z94_20115 [Ulvibacterium marinum]